MALDAAVLAALLQACAPNVAPATMVAVIRVESEGDPFKIGVNSGATLQRQPANAADAIATARGLLRRGANFDAGLMQINSANFARLGLTPETVFDPCTNLRAGAVVLADNYGRARDAGHSDPLRAAISEYNTGSRTRGLNNGYVGRVYAAAGQGDAPFASPRAAVVRLSDGASYGARISPDAVGRLLIGAFGGRITDTLRPMNATYGAQNSYHKYGQAVDFVPRGAVGAISRDQIRALMATNNISILELLGPGDPGHSDHWHIAFATNGRAPLAPTYEAPPAWSVAVARPAEDQIPVAVVTSWVAPDLATEGDRVGTADPVPPAWDVFATAAWHRRQSPNPTRSGL